MKKVKCDLFGCALNALIFASCSVLILVGAIVLYSHATVPVDPIEKLLKTPITLDNRALIIAELHGEASNLDQQALSAARQAEYLRSHAEWLEHGTVGDIGDEINYTEFEPYSVACESTNCIYRCGAK